MGKNIQRYVGSLDAAELLGTAQSGLWNDRDQVRFAERLDMQAHRGHRQIKSLRQLANGHGFVHQTFEDFQPGFRGKRLADFGGCFRIGKIQDDIFFVFNRFVFVHNFLISVQPHIITFLTGAAGTS